MFNVSIQVDFSTFVFSHLKITIHLEHWDLNHIKQRLICSKEEDKKMIGLENDIFEIDSILK